MNYRFVSCLRVFVSSCEIFFVSHKDTKTQRYEEERVLHDHAA